MAGENSGKGFSGWTLALTDVIAFALGFVGGYVTRDAMAEEQAKANGTSTTKKAG